MPRYRFGDTVVRRKNWYMPCIIGPKFDEADEAEQARILKATYWADYIAASEWRTLLEHNGCSPSARSRLKKKAAGWLIALARIYYLRPELFADIVQRADNAYSEQVESRSYLLEVLRMLAEVEARGRDEENKQIVMSAWLEEAEDAREAAG